jgi:putative endonuclease
MGDERKPLGRLGEDAACEALEGSGYRIVQRNYRCPLGELDLVARQGKTLVFVEVKSQSAGSGISGKDRVSKEKQRRLCKLAQFYIKEKGLHGISARFDVAEVRFREGALPEVEIIPNAFDADG